MSKAGAYILINVQAGKGHSVLSAMRKIPEAKLAHIVTGPYDIIVFVGADKTDDVINIVVNQVHKTPGITSTMTCVVAFVAGED